MNPVRHTHAIQQAQQNSGQRTEDGRIKPLPQIEAFFQLLPADQRERKSLIVRMIDKHNALCSNPNYKIQVSKPPFSASHPQLARWINETFSGMSAHSMSFIAFALGGFAEYHNLATSVHSGNTGKLNTQFIEDWFEVYGTEACIGSLLKLSNTFREIREWDQFYRSDINNFCSQAKQLNATKSNFKPITGTKEQSCPAANAYLAASTVFSNLYLFSGSLSFNNKIAIDVFCENYGQSTAMEEKYSRGNAHLNNAVMAAIDGYIKSNQQNPKFFQMLRSCFHKWEECGCRENVVQLFDNALGRR